MDSHLSITGLHRESARTPRRKWRRRRAKAKARFDKFFTDGPDLSKMAGVRAVMLFDGDCRDW